MIEHTKREQKTIFVSEEIPVNDIKVKTRLRKDIGNITSLYNSMGFLGLLNPIIVTADNYLVAGQRRLTVAKKLGWSSIAVRRLPFKYGEK